jgi:hypothetical protein
LNELLPAITANLTEMIASALKVFLLSITIYVVGTVALDEQVFLNPLAVEDLNYRLNDDVLPSHYAIKITPYFEHVS